jgi:hypothetical protein
VKRLAVLGVAILAALSATTAANGKATGCAGAVTWQTAMHSVGKTVTLRGRVESAHYTSSGVTYLDFGNRHPMPRRFTVVVFRDVSALEGRTVCVRGTVDAAWGVPEMQQVTLLRKV